MPYLDYIQNVKPSNNPVQRNQSALIKALARLKFRWNTGKLCNCRGETLCDQKRANENEIRRLRHMEAGNTQTKHERNTTNSSTVSNSLLIEPLADWR